MVRRQESQLGLAQLWYLAFLMAAIVVAQFLSTVGHAAVSKLDNSGFSAVLSTDAYADINTSESFNAAGLYRLSTSYSIAPIGLSFSSRLGFIQQYSYLNDDGSAYDFEDLSLNLRKKIKVSKSFGWGYGLDGTLPLSQASKKSTMIGGIGPSLVGSMTVGRVSLSSRIGTLHFGYDQEIRKDGKINVPHEFLALTSLSYSLTERLSLDGFLLYSLSLDFQGITKANTYFAAGIGYSITDNFSTGVGVTTLADTLNSEGSVNRLLLYDPAVTQAYLNFTIRM